MSIRQAIEQASKDVLADYLAPELVERLTDDILQRTAGELSRAVDAFVGFDFSAKPSPRGRALATAPLRKHAGARRGRRPGSAGEADGSMGAGREASSDHDSDQHSESDGDQGADYHPASRGDDGAGAEQLI